MHVDHEKHGHESEFHFRKGGIGHPFVRIEIVSQRGHGIKSEIFIYV